MANDDQSKVEQPNTYRPVLSDILSAKTVGIC